MKYFLLALLALGSYKGYSNYHSYPKHRKASLCHRTPKENNEINLFFKTWNPPGRDKPVFKGYKWKWGI